MYTFTTKTGTKITATATRGNKAAPWKPAGEHYRIMVNANGESISFDFWDSFHNMRNGIEVELRGALNSFALDAFAGMNASSAADIMSDFGYDNRAEAVRVFKGVKHAEAQAAKLGLSEEELSELADY